MNATDRSPSAADRRFINRLKESGPSSWLLLALIVLLIVYPFADESLAWQLILGALDSVLLVATALVAGGVWRTLYIALALMLPALVLQWTWVVTHDRTGGLGLGAFLTLFYIFVFGPAGEGEKIADQKDKKLGKCQS